MAGRAAAIAYQFLFAKLCALAYRFLFDVAELCEGLVRSFAAFRAGTLYSSHIDVNWVMGTAFPD